MGPNTPESERQFIVSIAQAVGTKLAIETGTARGDTARALADVCDHVVTLDTDRRCGEKASVWQARRHHIGDGLTGAVAEDRRVTFVEGDALENLPAALERAPEFVLLDVLHDPGHVCSQVDLVLATPSVRACVVHDTLAETGDAIGLGKALLARGEGWTLIDLGERPGLGVWFRPAERENGGASSA